jgi:prepilin peptidase CpaA
MIQGDPTVHFSATTPIVVALTAALIAATTDLWKFKVYNALTLPLLLSGLVYHGLQANLANSLVGILFGFAALFVLYVLGGMGAGDVKLMAAIGAWLGMPLTFCVFIASSLAAGVYAVLLMALSRGTGETLVNLRILWLRLSSIGRYLGADDSVEQKIIRSDRRGSLIPFAAMVAIGLITTLVWFGINPFP